MPTAQTTGPLTRGRSTRWGQGELASHRACAIWVVVADDDAVDVRPLQSDWDKDGGLLGKQTRNTTCSSSETNTEYYDVINIKSVAIMIIT